MVGAAETAGIVIITMATIQGLFKLLTHLIDKQERCRKQEREEKIIEVFVKVEEKLDTLGDCGLTEQQASELHELHVLHDRFDADGSPIWYVPRSWAETQKEIVDKLQNLANINYKMLGIIERLEQRLPSRE